MKMAATALDENGRFRKAARAFGIFLAIVAILAMGTIWEPPISNFHPQELALVVLVISFFLIRHDKSEIP
jgi:hypothetical protein